MKIDGKYVCEFCGKDYEYKITKNGKPNIIFCSQECCDNYNEQQQNKKFTICKNCGKEFQALRYMSGKYNRSSFCCKECESDYNIKTNSIIFGICKNCGKEFERKRCETSKKFSKAEFCSNTCASEYRKIIPIGFDKCIVCGKIFKEEKMTCDNNKFKQRKFCSDECKEKYLKEKYNKSKLRECKQCGKIFELNKEYHDTRIFCSDNCLKEFEYNSHLISQKCKYCGKDFIPEKTPSGRKSRSVFCSNDCWLHYWQDMNQKRYGVPYTFMLNNKHLKISKENFAFADLLEENNITYKLEYELTKRKFISLFIRFLFT